MRNLLKSLALLALHLTVVLMAPSVPAAVQAIPKLPQAENRLPLSNEVWVMKLTAATKAIVGRYNSSAQLTYGTRVDVDMEIGAVPFTLVDVIKLRALAPDRVNGCSTSYFPVDSKLNLVCTSPNKRYRLSVKAKVGFDFQLIEILGQDVTVEIDKGQPTEKIIKGSVPVTRFHAQKDANNTITGYRLQTASK